MMRLKKLDGLLIKSFLPPFVLATFIALFVLIMQTLWLYIDDILGKGASMFIVLEFLAYLSMSLVPLALPIGVLLASVMLFGNLGERYELSSMKSAGISLFRIMLPLIALCAGISVFSLICNEYVIPYSNLKFKSRLYDLRKSRPTLNLEEGVFNEDFAGYVIHIGNKSEDGRNIKDVLIYDHQNTATKGETNIIKAKSGEMYATPDNNFFVMKLYDGHMYQEMSRRTKGNTSEYPFVRSSFQEWTKIFDLRQFDLNRTDEDLFKSNQSMKNSAQLSADIDSMQMRQMDLRNNSVRALTSIYIAPNKSGPEKEISQEKPNDQPIDSIQDSQVQPEGNRGLSDLVSRPQVDNEVDRIKERALENMRKGRRYGNLFVQKEVDLDTIDFFFQTFDKTRMLGLMNGLESEIKVQTQRLKANESAYDNLGKKIIKHIYELNIKFSYALVCIVFLFIGAPMGAIVRKGGFGYPLLISIFFFIIFILLTIFCKKLAESRALDATLAAWVPMLALVPIGLLLTYQAMNDSKFLSLSGIVKFFSKLFKKEAS